jgi:isopenicillin N synthase-like dioxygenase
MFVRMPPDAIPVIDLAGADDPAARPTVARALVEGIAGSACVWVEGHGVPDDLLAGVASVSRRFFALPRPDKARVEWDGIGLWRGWQPAIEGADRYGGATRQTDMLERLEQNFTPALGGVDAQGNRWPAEPPELRPTWERYAAQVGEVSSGLVRLLAEALDLPAADLGPWTAGRSCNLVANHYPPVPPDAPAGGRPRLQAHADHSGLTILLLDDAAGGLESRSLDGTWREVGYRPGALLVQVGTLLQHWTNGLLPPNVHRVCLPEPGTGGRPERMSIAWFHYPDRAVVVEPAPSCVGADGPRFGSLAAGSYTASRQAAYGRGEATKV